MMWAKRADGWMNLLTGFNDPERDKRLAASFAFSPLPMEHAAWLYRGNDMAARIVDTVPEEMLRKGFSVTVEGDSSLAEDVNAVIEELGVASTFHDAMRWARALGGAGILLGADDGQKDLTQPLNLDAIKRLGWLTMLDARELYASTYYNDPQHPKYGQPKLYAIQPSTGSGGLEGSGDPLHQVHESRIIRFEGVKLSRLEMRNNRGWGDSVLQRPKEVLRDFDTTWDAAGLLVQDFGQGVLKLAGLSNVLQNDPDAFKARMQAMDMTRSLLRMMVVDASSGEGFERKPTPISGLPELLDRFCNRLAAAARIPVTLLMGQAPAGLNATGESDLRGFYDHVASDRERDLTPPLTRLIRILLRSKTGPTGGVEPENWSIKYPSLWQLDETQEADRRLKIAQTDEINIRSGIYSPEEAATSHYRGDQFNPEIQLDWETRDAMAAADKAPPEASDTTAVPAPTDSRTDAADLEHAERVAFRADAGHRGVAVMLPVPSDLARLLAVNGGEAPEDLHLTLAFLGTTDTLPADRIDVVKAVLESISGVGVRPIDGQVSGVGRFSIADGDAFYLSVDSPTLVKRREAICAVLETAGVPPSMKHGFTPHITLKYLGDGEAAPIDRVDLLPITFDRLALWVGDERFDFPFEPLPVLE